MFGVQIRTSPDVSPKASEMNRSRSPPAAKEFVVQNLERSRMDELGVDELGVSRVRICFF